MELVRFAWSRIRGDLRRSLATFAAITIAVTSFVVLAASTATQQAAVTETAEANYRAAYDILVRPKGSALEKERVEGLVRSNYLSGTFGGLTLKQYEAIKAIRGVEVAAPIAMLGYEYQQIPVVIDTKSLLADSGQTLLRYRSEITARNGTAKAPGPSGYRYQTDRELKYYEGNLLELKDGELGRYGQWEVADGSVKYPCPISEEEPTLSGPFDPATLWQQGRCMSTRPGQASGSGNTEIPLEVTYPMLIAAVDPAAEAALVGLDSAVYEGRYFTAEDTFTPGDKVPAQGNGEHYPDVVPVVLAGTQDADYQLHVTLESLPRSVIDQLGKDVNLEHVRTLIQHADATAVVQDRTIDASTLYADHIKGLTANQPAPEQTGEDPAEFPLSLRKLWRPADVTYQPGSPLRPVTVGVDKTQWRAVFESSNSGFETVPFTAQDTSYRSTAAYTVHEYSHGSNSSGIGGNAINFQVVGKFDPAGIKEFSGLSAVPLETYRAPSLVGADQASREALGDQAMRGDLNVAGYLQQTPSILIPLNAIGAFRSNRLGVFDPEDFKQVADFDDTAPVSAVRVRVGGVTGMDQASRERIAAVAASITDAVGADVDITIGSSPEMQQAHLPATTLGSPSLNLVEPWSRKGVAIQIVAAIDAKSLLLFGLILISSALTVAISAGAAVRARRRELGILAAIGWTAARRRNAILAELTIIGAAAGILGAVLSWPLALLAQARFDWQQAVLAVVAATILAPVAGSAAAWRAGRVHPIEALRATERGGGRRTLPLWGGVSLGVIRILRRPGRLLLGSVAIALPVTSLLVLTSLSQVFSGRVVGTLLGDTVAILVRPQDLVAGAFLGLLGLGALALILFLNIAEDAPMYASLQAIGWRQAWLARSLSVQAITIGLVGSAIGLAAGLGIMLWLTETIPTQVVQISAITVATTLAATLLVSLGPAAALRHLPTARLLAEE